MTVIFRWLLAACVLAMMLPAVGRAADPGTGWDDRALYTGWLAGALVGVEVQGLRGDELGAVRDLVLSPDGTIKAMAVEASGMLGLGEAEFLVPWTEVEIGPLPDTILVQAVDADVPSLIRGSAAFERTAADWRIADLLGRPVHLVGQRAFGTVKDLVFGRDGTLLAVLVSPDGGGDGPYAYPWALALVDRRTGVVHLPGTPEQLRTSGPFGLNRLGTGIFAGHPP